MVSYNLEPTFRRGNWPFPSAIKVKVVEKNIRIKKREIIFTGKSSLSVINFDFKPKIPKQQNKTKFKFIAIFPKIKLIGKRPNTKFVAENKFIL